MLFLVCLDSYDITTFLFDSCTAWKSVLTYVGKVCGVLISGSSDSYISRNCSFTSPLFSNDDETTSKLSSQLIDILSGFFGIDHFETALSNSLISQRQFSVTSLTKTSSRVLDNVKSDGAANPGTIILSSIVTFFGSRTLNIDISFECSRTTYSLFRRKNIPLTVFTADTLMSSVSGKKHQFSYRS